ncbi:MAG: winged helix-turn-helix domain-containing protein [Actinobacteria bacterium]|nr:winged helix-turn-helix domain-containing protein [Actinomycetota bacterium]
MDFRVLGPLELSRDGTPVRLSSRMQRRLLAMLLIHAGDPVSADRMIDVLWGGEPPPSAWGGLQTYVSRLRRALTDGGEIRSDEHGYRLRVADERVDARRFERLAAAARAHLPEKPAEAASRFSDALALWRGPAYVEFADEDFARAEAVRLDELRLAATEEAFAARLACGDASLIADLEASVTAHPLRERPHALLMTALARAGRQSEALEVFRRLRRRLADELGLEPSPALHEVQGDVLRQAAGTEPQQAPGTGSAGAAAAAAGDGQPPGNLPRPVTSFVGRQHERDAVRRLLGRGRMVTLVGVGGVGKTRLTLQAAAGVAANHVDGVWWCELAPADPEAVGHTIATVLGVQPQAQRSIADSIADALVDKSLLLVLDNCEHVVTATAELAGQLLGRCSDVTILATSREPLTVDGEQVWRVPPLALPPQGGETGGERTASAQLFFDRARDFDADLAVDETMEAAVADVCRQLDGLPLAIELAAALTPALEPAEIARRLGDRFRLLTHGPRTDPRHRTLAAVVAWSYQLLERDEQQLFDRFAVFAGGFTLSAAEGVCADEHIPRGQVAGLLAGLVSRSMVNVDRSAAPPRYHLLETLRQYAGERLAERGEHGALRARHAAWFTDLAEQADAQLRGPDEPDAVARLDVELANLRAAHRWAVEQGDADLALRLAAALHIFAFYRLRDEVFVWTEQAAQLRAAAGHRLAPTAWGVAALGATNRGELIRARTLAERALAAAPDPTAPGLYPALYALGAADLYEGRLADSRHRHEQAHEASRRAGDAYCCGLAQLHGVFPIIYDLQRQDGLTAAQAARATAETLGSPRQRGWSRYAHAEALGDDDPDEALRLLDEAMTLAEHVGDRLLQGVVCVATTTLAARHRSPRQALDSFADVIRHWRRAGVWTHQWTTLRNLVWVLTRLNAHEPAALLYGAQHAADSAAPTYGADAERLADARRTLASRLGEANFETLADQGAQLSARQAVDLALTGIDITQGNTPTSA